MKKILIVTGMPLAGKSMFCEVVKEKQIKNGFLTLKENCFGEKLNYLVLKSFTKREFIMERDQ